jgi:Domain of unknown function (DUF397)
MKTTDKLHWFKSSYSGGDGDNCVEIALHPDGIHIRDSKDPSIAQLIMTPRAWSVFATHAASRSPKA